MSPLQSVLLDLFRWAAAFLVVVEHLRSLMFTSYLSRTGICVCGRVWYFLTNFGHPAVMVFFVMSGFLVGGKCLESLAQGSFSWRKYWIDRASRLYAVYALALLLGALFDRVGYLYLNRFGLYDLSFSGHIASVNQNFHTAGSPVNFLVNLAMCQTILGPVFGSNGPLWSLANEFWYYLAGPLLFALVYLRDLRAKALCTIALGLCIWFLPMGILVYGLIWLLGASLYFVNDRRFLPLWLSLALFGAAFCAARFQLIKVPYVQDFLIGISFALIINSAATSARSLPWRNLSRKAADFSYSVYLCHFPFLIFLLSALYQLTGFTLRGPFTALRLAQCCGVLVLVYAWCYLVSLATERQTPRTRRILYRLIGEPTRPLRDDLQPRPLPRPELSDSTR